MPNATYVPSTKQLVLVLFVRDIEASTAFYRRLGFQLIREQPAFRGLAWEHHLFLLEEHKDLPPPGHLRVSR